MLSKIKDLIYRLLFRQQIIISSDESLSDKVILVTGASKGIGKSTAEVLLKKGATVIAVARSKEELETAFKSEKKCLTIVGDVTSENDCKQIIDRSIREFKKIDVLINNAGVFKGNYIEDMSETDWNSVISVNLKGIFLMCKFVIPEMKKNNQGLILNIGSKISHNSKIDPQKVAYATSKYAVEGFSSALGNELKPFGIRVSCLMPATVNTFRSLDAAKYLSPYKLGEMISLIVKHEDIYVESMILKSNKQDI